MTKTEKSDPIKYKLYSVWEGMRKRCNWWGDKFWGVCNGEGQNHLGKLLMKIREEIKNVNL